MKRVLSELPWVVVPFALIAAAHVIFDRASEPFYNNDETRHVMTGVFVRDAIADGGWRNPKDYAVRYYLQYPALGLMVWPPFFYSVEGVWMSVFGVSFTGAKLLVGLFGIIAGISFYRLVRRSWEPPAASLALLLCGFTPLIFSFSRQVMLEIPCLAIALTAIFHFERFLCEGKRRDAWMACLLAAVAALTRFDAVFLLPYFSIRLLATRNFRLLTRGCVLGGIALALLLTGPYYLYTWREYGSTISQTVQTGSSANATSFLAWRNFYYYPSVMPEQVGWPVAVAAVLGMAISFRRSETGSNRKWSSPSKSGSTTGAFFALTAATYLTFTPMAEMDARHAIYWVPALAYFTVVACLAIARWANRSGIAALSALGLTCAAAFVSTNVPHYHVFGYEDAATYVVANTRERPVVLMDGFLNGDFIYQVRRHDPERRLWVLRGDKLLYSMLCDPHAGYEEYARSEREMLDLINRFDPELIVLEEPQLYFELPAATMLRQVIRTHPERFRLDASFPIRSDHFRFANARLQVWRNLIRNPNREKRIEIDMLNLKKSLGAEMGP